MNTDLDSHQDNYQFTKINPITQSQLLLIQRINYKQKDNIYFTSGRGICKLACPMQDGLNLNFPQEEEEEEDEDDGAEEDGDEILKDSSKPGNSEFSNKRLDNRLSNHAIEMAMLNHHTLGMVASSQPVINGDASPTINGLPPEIDTRTRRQSMRTSEVAGKKSITKIKTKSNDKIGLLSASVKKGSALPFLQIDNQDNLVLNPQLGEIMYRQEGNVSFVVVMGRDKTMDKSLFLNSLLKLEKGRNFPVPPIGKVKGLLIWSEPLYLQASNTFIYFIECQSINIKRMRHLKLLLFALHLADLLLIVTPDTTELEQQLPILQKLYSSIQQESFIPSIVPVIIDMNSKRILQEHILRDSIADKLLPMINSLTIEQTSEFNAQTLKDSIQDSFSSDSDSDKDSLDSKGEYLFRAHSTADGKRGYQENELQGTFRLSKQIYLATYLVAETENNRECEHCQKHISSNTLQPPQHLMHNSFSYSTKLTKSSSEHYPLENMLRDVVFLIPEQSDLPRACKASCRVALTFTVALVKQLNQEEGLQFELTDVISEVVQLECAWVEHKTFEVYQENVAVMFDGDVLQSNERMYRILTEVREAALEKYDVALEKFEAFPEYSKCRQNLKARINQCEKEMRALNDKLIQGENDFLIVTLQKQHLNSSTESAHALSSEDQKKKLKDSFELKYRTFLTQLQNSIQNFEMGRSETASNKSKKQASSIESQTVNSLRNFFAKKYVEDLRYFLHQYDNLSNESLRRQEPLLQLRATLEQHLKILQKKMENIDIVCKSLQEEIQNLKVIKNKYDLPLPPFAQDSPEFNQRQHSADIIFKEEQALIEKRDLLLRQLQKQKEKQDRSIFRLHSSSSQQQQQQQLKQAQSLPQPDQPQQYYLPEKNNFLQLQIEYAQNGTSLHAAQSKQLENVSNGLQMPRNPLQAAMSTQMSVQQQTVTQLTKPFIQQN